LISKVEMMNVIRTITFCCIITLAACGSDECNNEISYPDITGSQVYKQDSLALRAYLEANNQEINITPSGLYYIVTQEGNGRTPNICDEIDVDYQGFFLDGTLFEETERASFPLSGVIKGWQEGMQLFSEQGGQGQLLIPSYLAYGVNGRGPVPANTPLIFNITLNAIN